MAWSERRVNGRYRGGYRDATGATHYVRGTFTHKAAAQRAAAALEDKARRRLAGDPDAHKRTWAEWQVEWMESRVSEASTRRVDESRIKNHLGPRWNAVKLGAISRHDVKEWAAAMRRDGKSAELVRRCVDLFSASLNAAMDAEIIEANPAARITLERGQQAQERFLTREEFVALVANLPSPRDQLVVKMLANTGLRWSELAGLHWNRVDLGRGTLRVVETWDEAAEQMKSYPKSRHVRDVPIPPWLVAELRKLPVTIGGCGHDHAAGECRSGLVFTTRFNNVLRHTKWSRVWRTAVEDAEIGHTRIHDLRHTYASWLLQAGVPLAEVGRLLGHVSTQTTQKYAHLAEVPSAAVAAALPAPNVLPAISTEEVPIEVRALGKGKGQGSHTPDRPTGPSEVRPDR